jgi:hypothetical protein
MHVCFYGCAERCRPSADNYQVILVVLRYGCSPSSVNAQFSQ